jgi:hypothetical protein
MHFLVRKKGLVSCFSISRKGAPCSFYKKVPASFHIQKLSYDHPPASFPGSTDVKQGLVSFPNLLMWKVDLIFAWQIDSAAGQPCAALLRCLPASSNRLD